MKKHFVPSYLAYKLKNVGFNDPCIAHYQGESLTQIGSFSAADALSPTWTQIFDWFDDKFDLYSTIDIGEKDEKGITYNYSILNHSNVVDDTHRSFGFDYASKQKARVACLEKLISLIS